MNDTDEDGNTALAFAAFKSKPEVVKALLGAKAYVNARNCNGHTPLMSSVMGPLVKDTKKVTDCVVELLAANADVGMLNAKGESALDKAVIFGASESVCGLLKKF